MEERQISLIFHLTVFQNTILCLEYINEKENDMRIQIEYIHPPYPFHSHHLQFSKLSSIVSIHQNHTYPVKPEIWTTNGEKTIAECDCVLLLFFFVIYDLHWDIMFPLDTNVVFGVKEGFLPDYWCCVPAICDDLACLPANASVWLYPPVILR